MVKGTITIVTPGGLHMRPAGVLCKHATKYLSKIEFKYKDSMINVKSVLSVLGACICAGEEAELICTGTDEEKAFAELSQLIAGGLSE
ncbi:MAG: HPr family phosphocarrier protein [Lachnospiraceae bacterium]|nr:HPr family phosphocarrier protein [Lachnospiraceae bacterium]